MLKKFPEIFEKTKLSEALNEMLTMHKGVFELFLLQGKLHLTAIPKVIFIAYTLYHFLKNITSLQKQYFIWESLLLTLVLQQTVNLSPVKAVSLSWVILWYSCFHVSVHTDPASIHFNREGMWNFPAECWRTKTEVRILSSGVSFCLQLGNWDERMSPLSNIGSSQKKNFVLLVAFPPFLYITHCQQYIHFQGSTEFNWGSVATVLLALGHIFHWFHYFIAFIISGMVIGHEVASHYPSASGLRQRFKYHCISSELYVEHRTV